MWQLQFSPTKPWDNEVQISSWLREASNSFQRAGIESAHLDALLLLEHYLKKSREWILAHEEEVIGDKLLSKLNKARDQRLNREPLAYITGEKEFYGRTFSVDENVLIPRPESEAIIELLKQILKQVQDDTQIIDVGTGSGCLAITAKLELPEADVIATDISDEALKTASVNAKTLNARVEFIRSDLLESMPRSKFELANSIILANLPYVPDGLITSEEITKEPGLALFSGSDGLNCYRKFWKQILELKNPPMAVITESLENQHEKLAQLAKSAGYKLKSTNGLAQLFIR